MEKNDDKPMSATQVRIRTNVTIKGSKPSINKTIPSPDERDATIRILARGTLQIPPGRRGPKEPTGRKT